MSIMLTKNRLLLGSKSSPRRILLEQSKIPFTVIEQHADEIICTIGLTRAQQVTAIAAQKMEHVILPPFSGQEIIFVLTADTLTEDSTGTIHGKPTDYADAVAMIKLARAGMSLSTAFCLETKIWSHNNWVTKDRIAQVISADYITDCPDNVIDYYLQNSNALECSGGFAVEGLGLQFIKTMHGSFSTIMGLPLFEVRQALDSLNFFCL
jgi:septum formation protein